MADLLVQAKLVTTDDVAKGLERMVGSGGRLGDNLVAIGAIDQKVLNDFLHRIPGEPADIKATGIDELDLMGLLMKLMYSGRLETCRQFVEAIKLPYPIVIELVTMAIDRHLIHSLGTRGSSGPLDLAYSFTEEGKRWTLDALERLRYIGPAPVAIDDFTFRVNLQKLTNELVTFDRIRGGLGNLILEDTMIEQYGPALNSGRAMLLYGPPGTGKTMLALRIPGILPPLSRGESLETTRIYSALGLLPDGIALMDTRPVRSPHHSATRPSADTAASAPSVS